MIHAMAMPLGQVVQSLKGRDKDKIYVVIGHGCSPYILVADGRDRKAAEPKKKNIRHVKAVGNVSDDVAHRPDRGDKFTDEQLRRIISETENAVCFAKVRTGRES